MTMQRLKFIDNMPLDRVETTAQGFLRIPVTTGRVGIQDYIGPDGGTVKELRPHEEVFSPKTMSSLIGIPVVNDHPKEMLNPKNTKDYIVGYAGDSPKQDGKMQATHVTIFDEKTIQDINDGKIEMSLGYEADIDKVSGFYDGMMYDVIQRNIVNNHLALVDKGRAGADVRLRFDSCDYIRLDNNNQENKGGNMPKVKIGDEEFEVPEQMKKDMESAMKSKKDAEEEEEKKKEDEDKLKKDLEEEKEKKDKEEKEKKDKEEEEKEDEDEEKKEDKMDAMQAKIDALEDKLSSQRLDARDVALLVRERKGLEDNANKILSASAVEKLDGMEDIEIKKAVIIASTKKEVKLDGKSDVYINARYDALVDTLDVSDNAYKKASDKFQKYDMDDNDREDATSDEIRESSMRTDSEAWKLPVGKHSKQV